MDCQREPLHLIAGDCGQKVGDRTRQEPLYLTVMNCQREPLHLIARDCGQKVGDHARPRSLSLVAGDYWWEPLEVNTLALACTAGTPNVIS